MDTPFVETLLVLPEFNRGGNIRVFRLPGAGGDRFHCTVEPSPGHVRCRFWGLNQAAMISRKHPSQRDAIFFGQIWPPKKTKKNTFTPNREKRALELKKPHFPPPQKRAFLGWGENGGFSTPIPSFHDLGFLALVQGGRIRKLGHRCWLPKLHLH